MEGELIKEEQMLINSYGFSISVGNIIESSITKSSSSSTEQQFSPTGSEINSQAMINNVKTKNPGASNKTRCRKRTNNSQTQTVKTTNLTDDGFGWRKYGQKTIHNQEHPKSYYRCTHHKEEKCEAKKWVQQESENPPIYKTTYLGHHTCKNPLKIPQIFYPDYSSSSSSFSTDNNITSFNYQNVLLCFDSPTSNHSSNINADEQMKTEPVLIPSSTDVDFMMFFADHDQGLEIDTYGNYESSYFPSVPSPNSSFESCDFSMMIQELLLDHDNVNFMHEF